MASNFPDCAMCNNPATKRCSVCRCNNLYCSKQCQTADWKLHKILCKSRPSFETPPSPDSRRAIVFTVEGEIKFIWVTVKTETDGESDDEDCPSLSWEVPVGLETYFGGNPPTHEPFYSNTVRRRTVKELIDIRLNDNFLSDGSPKNLAVCRVVTNMDDGRKTWRDSLVALKRKGSWLDAERSNPNPVAGYGHMDMGDFREVIDYLIDWKRSVNLDRETKVREAKEKTKSLPGGPWDVIVL